MSINDNKRKLLERKVKSLSAKFDALEQECTARGIELTRINNLVERTPIPEPIRMLLRKPLDSYLKRCGQGQKKE